MAFIDWLPPVRSMRNFFGTYGTTTGSIRGVLNGIIPVAMVDRYRDDDEGSLFGMTVTAQGDANDHSTVAFGSSQNDWELVAANWGWFWPLGHPSGTVMMGNIMMYTPPSTFQPITTFRPSGIFVPGLTPDWSFTFGSVNGFAGYNPNLPPIFGSFPFESHAKTTSSTLLNSVDFNWQEAVFDPPIRIYRDVVLAFTQIETFSRDMDLTVSIRYRERPRTTAGPATG